MNVLCNSSEFDQIQNKHFSDEQISQSLYVIRCIAVLAVITAHVNNIDDSNLLSNIITHIWAIIARFGVPAFLISGGYYYHREKKDSKRFWKKKLFSVIIPWFFSSIITYGVSAVLCRSASLIAYLKWFIGFNTFLYYMTVYLFMLVIFKFVNKTPFLIALIILTFGSLLLEQINGYNDYNNLMMTAYLNPFNWVGYFSFGILIKRFNLEQKIGKGIVLISIIIFLLFFSIEWYYDEMTYFSIFNPITQTALLIILFAVINRISIKLNFPRILLFTGCNSLVIYLYHLQIVQFLLKYLPNMWFFQLIKPVIGLLIMVIIVFVGCLVLKRFPNGRNIMKYLGLKEYK